MRKILTLFLTVTSLSLMCAPLVNAQDQSYEQRMQDRAFAEAQEADELYSQANQAEAQDDYDNACKLYNRAFIKYDDAKDDINSMSNFNSGTTNSNGDTYKYDYHQITKLALQFSKSAKIASKKGDAACAKRNKAR